MPNKQKIFADVAGKELPDVMALQEVNQCFDAPLESHVSSFYTPAQESVPVRQGNHAQALSELLEAQGTPYYWSWLPVKVGYGKYDEGLALFSRKPILEIRDVPVSGIQDYANYRTRRLLGIRTEDGWFYSVHFSWWNDPDEPFLAQFKRLKPFLPTGQPVWLMGDFNGDPSVRNETYDTVAASGLRDTFTEAAQHDDGYTMSGVIDGWHNQPFAEKRRIDQIWTNDPRAVLSSRVIFSGKSEPVISDHFGILVETGD